MMGSKQVRATQAPEARTRRRGSALLLAATLFAFAMPASAQFSPSYKFLDAIRKSDNETVTKYVEAPGTTLVNTRDRTTGETALLITVGRRDTTYMKYLLGHGARTDIASNDGRTPLMLAVERRFPEGIDILIAYNVNVNQTNPSGETALIRAVQMHDVGMVRQLITAGANPDKADTLAGMSARDYAARDAQNVPGMAEAIAAAKPSAPAKDVQGPVF